MNRRTVRIAGYALSAACLVVLAANVDWTRFVGFVRNASPLPLAAAVPLVVATYVLFAMRWRLLVTFDPRPTFLRVFGFLMLGYLANALLPMRAGDALRVVLLRRDYGHGATRAAGSVALERVLDVATIVALGLAVALNADLPEAIRVVLRTAGFAAVAAVALVVAVAARPRGAATMLDTIARRIDARLADALALQVEQFVAAMNVLVPRNRGGALRVAAAVALSLAGWIVYGLAMSLCTAAFGVQTPVAAGMLLTVLTNLGSAIPSSPASLGVYHALGVVALSPWHVGFDRALSIATVTHVITVGVQIALGLAAMLLLKVQHPLASASALSDRGG